MVLSPNAKVISVGQVKPIEIHFQRHVHIPIYVQISNKVSQISHKINPVL